MALSSTAAADASIPILCAVEAVAAASTGNVASTGKALADDVERLNGAATSNTLTSVTSITNLPET